MRGLGLGLGLSRRRNRLPSKPPNVDEVILEIENLEKVPIWIPNIENELMEYVRRDPTAVYRMAPRTFEELIASIFKNQGFNVELTPFSKDGGYDIVAVSNSSLSERQDFLIECKRYAPENKVGVAIIRALYGVVRMEKATKGILVTSSSFTAGIHAFQKRDIDRLSLADYDSIKDWVRKST